VKWNGKYGRKIVKRYFLPYFPYLFTIQFAFSHYFSYHFTIQLAFLSYLQYLFTIFLPYFPLYGKYGGKASWIVKWFGKYGRKVSEMWNDMENMAEIQVE
jgi:hypothetical protein